MTTKPVSRSDTTLPLPDVIARADPLTPARPAHIVDARRQRDPKRTAARWFRAAQPVRFVADVSVVQRWSEAKG